MPDPEPVDDRVSGDRPRDQQREAGAGPARAAATDEQDPGRNHDNARDFGQRRIRARSRDRDHEGEHGRQPTREGIDQAQLVAAIGGCEQDHVGQFEPARAEHVGHRAAFDAPGDCRQRREGGDQDGNGQRRGRLGIALAGEEEVPDGVERRRRQREPESGGAQW